MKRFLTYTGVMASFAMFGFSEHVEALPPLGLTHVGALSGGDLEIIDGAAYVGVNGSVTRVDSEGRLTVTEVVHPELGAASSVTPVVEAHDGELYVGANFDADPLQVAFTGPALFNLEEPTEPVVTWDGDEHHDPFILGVDRGLRGVGNIYVFSEITGGSEPSAAALHLDGSVELLERPAADIAGCVTEVSPSGYALGSAGVPGTIGSGVALWTPGGSFSFISEFGAPHSLRDRLDGRGVNVGYAGDALIIYGEQAASNVYAPGTHDVLVSHGDFALLEEDRRAPLADDYLAYFPGIVPDDPTRAVPLFDVFPQLESANFDRITDLAAVDGRIYMTLYGEDGLYLFGAHDPSVIPEPSSLVLAVGVVAIGILALRQGRASRGVRASLR